VFANRGAYKWCIASSTDDVRFSQCTFPTEAAAIDALADELEIPQ
jgi:hypothetical protein